MVIDFWQIELFHSCFLVPAIDKGEEFQGLMTGFHVSPWESRAPMHGAPGARGSILPEDKARRSQSRNNWSSCRPLTDNFADWSTGETRELERLNPVQTR